MVGCSIVRSRERISAGLAVLHRHGERLGLLLVLAALLACGAGQGAKIEFVDKLDAPEEYREVGHLECERTVQPAGGSGMVQTKDPKPDKNHASCKDELRRGAARLKADVLVLEHEQVGTDDCTWCVTMSVVAFQRTSTESDSSGAGSESAANEPTGTNKTKRDLQQQSGTCFAVGPNGTVATAAHVVEGALAISVAMLGSSFEGARVIKRSEKDDLALLKIKSSTPDYLHLVQSADVQAGDSVFTLGFPIIEWLGVEPKFTDGSVSAVHGPKGADHYMQITVPIQPGNSGGPLLNENGQVVGVVTATARVKEFFELTGTLPQDINFAVRVDRLRELLGPVQQEDGSEDSAVEAPEGESPKSRREAISRVRPALCAIRVTTEADSGGGE